MKSIASVLACTFLVGSEQQVQARRVQVASAGAAAVEPLKAFGKLLSELKPAAAFSPPSLAVHVVSRQPHLHHRVPPTSMGDVVLDAKSLAASLGWDYDEKKAFLDRMMRLGFAEHVLKPYEYTPAQEALEWGRKQVKQEAPSMDVLKTYEYTSAQEVLGWGKRTVAQEEPSMLPQLLAQELADPKAAPAANKAEPEAATAPAVEKATPKAKAAPKRKPTPTGIFAPAVLAAKRVMGEKELQKLRADIIKKHSKVIADFVDTNESPFGQLVLSRMFEAADRDNSGTLDKVEIQDALYALGFTFVKEKDVDKIMKKADVDENEVIDFEEFVKATPQVLRMNLVNLARANGHDLGFLA